MCLTVNRGRVFTQKKAKVIFHVLEKCLGRLESKGGNYEKVNFVLTLD